MPNETIVQYILNVDTDRAEKGLKDTSQASRQVEQSFDKVGQATTQMNAKLKSTEQQAKRTSQGFRNLRRAGRDLDGAFSDLGQGIGLVSPAAGNLFMTLSNGASIAEGLGRVIVGFLNPAMLGVVAVTATAGVAFSVFTANQKAAAEQEKRLAETAEQTNRVLENQKSVTDKASSAISGYVQQLANAQRDLAVATGKLTEFDVAMQNARASSVAFGKNLRFQVDQQIAATRASEEALRSEIKQLDIIIAKEKARVSEQKISAVERAAGAKISIDQLSEETRAQIRRRDALSQQLDIVNSTLSSQEQQKREINGQVIEYRKTLEGLEKIKEENRIRDEQESENSKKIAQSERERTKQQAAAQKLQGIINKLTLGELTGREKILEQYNQELIKISELAELSGDIEKAVEAELLLRERKDRLLDEELRKEQEKLAIQKLQAKEVLSIISSTVQALRSPEAFVSGLGGIVGQVGAAAGSAGLTTAGPTISAAGSAVTAIAGFGGLIQQAIDESDVSLDENQARRVVLGNMNEAFQNFNRDLERGLELLPETLVRVLPAFVVSLAKVLTVDLARVIAVDLPVALIRSIPEVTIAVINEVAFLLADLVNGFKFALDQFTSFIQSVFTREGRRDAVASSIDGLKRFFETRFDGVGALRDSVSAFAGGGSFIPQAAGGMRFTGNQRSGLAMLHQGEFVVPQSGMRPQSVDRQMSRSGGSPINIVINSPVVEQNAVDALVRRIEERFNSNFGLGSSNLFGGR